MFDGKTYGIREVCDVVFKAKTDLKIGTQSFKKGQPVLYIDTAKTSNVEGASTTVYAQGGKGNPRLIGWDGEKTLTFTVEDALISPLSFSMLSGAGIMQASKDNAIKVHTTFDLPILDGGIVKIDYDTAGDNHNIYISDEIPAFGMVLDENGAGIVPVELHVHKDSSAINSDKDHEYVITAAEGKELILESEAIARYVGQTLRVDTYAVKKSGAVEMTIDAKNFAGSYYVEASTLWRDQNGVDHPAELVFPNVKIQSNFTFTMANSGDPSTFTFTMDAFPAYTAFDKKNKVMAGMQIIDDSDLDAISETATTRPELAVEFVDIIAGVSKFGDDKQFDGDPKNVQFAALGSNLKTNFTPGETEVDFSGTLRKVENWTAFSDKPADLTGYYIPFTVEVDGDADLIRTTLSGDKKTIKINGSENLVWAVDPKKPVIDVTLKSGDNETVYTWDFSTVKFA